MNLSWVGWHIPVISVLGRLREEDERFRDCLKNKTTNESRNVFGSVK